MKVLYPEKYFLLRGNHEFDSMCSQYGFKKEIFNYHNPKKIEKSPKKHSSANYDNKPFNLDEELEKQEKKSESPEILCDEYFANHVNIYCYKYTEKLYNSLIDSFSSLPIAAIVNNTTFCIHGGLSPHLDKIEKIDKLIKRPIFGLDQNPMLTDLLWSDPSPGTEDMFSENPRGKGKLFNKTATLTFLKNNFLNRMIRAHECITDGFQIMFNEKCITVFSASSYDRDMGNKSGIIELFESDDRINAIEFRPFTRLKKFDALYYKVKSFTSWVPKAPVLTKFVSAPLHDIEKSDKNSDCYNLKAKSRRRASFNIKIPFNTGFSVEKKNICPLSPNDSSRSNNIPHLNNWRFSDDSARMSSTLKRASLPMLNKNV